jgi:hypothetical protein
MKVNNRNILFKILILCFSFYIRIEAQTNDTIILGKRLNTVWGRKISPDNMANFRFTSYYKIYFKLGSNGTWRRTGVFGKKLHPYLKNDEAIQLNFNEYKKAKRQSYVLYFGSVIGIYAWEAYLVHRWSLVNQFYLSSLWEPASLALFILPEISFYIGRKRNIKGDLKLMRAVYLNNNNYLFKQ